MTEARNPQRVKLRIFARKTLSISIMFKERHLSSRQRKIQETISPRFQE